MYWGLSYSNRIFSTLEICRNTLNISPAQRYKMAAVKKPWDVDVKYKIQNSRIWKPLYIFHATIIFWDRFFRTHFGFPDNGWHHHSFLLVFCVWTSQPAKVIRCYTTDIWHMVIAANQPICLKLYFFYPGDGNGLNLKLAFRQHFNNVHVQKNV